MSRPLPPLSPTAVQVWHLRLDYEPDHLARLAATLSAAEHRRAARFHHAGDRARFIAARGVLREILGSYLAQPPAQVRLRYGRYGKPAVAAMPFQPALAFNLAHSGDQALYALTLAPAVGIDLEQIVPIRDLDQIVRLIGTASEQNAWQGLQPEQRLPAFFQLWAAKEAYLKAEGVGLRWAPATVEIAPLLDPCLVAGSPLQAASAWHLYSFQPCPGYAAAVAVRGLAPPVLCGTWPPA